LFFKASGAISANVCSIHLVEKPIVTEAAVPRGGIDNASFDHAFKRAAQFCRFAPARLRTGTAPTVSCRRQFARVIREAIYRRFSASLAFSPA